MTARYPSAWSSLRYPWVRAELLEYVAELCDPAATANWLKPDPQGPIIGIDQTFHFFFDDHDFDAGEIGYSLFDEEEVAAIVGIKGALNAIHVTNKAGDDRYFLEHPLWPSVLDAARTARDLLSAKGVATFE
jgi:hypothetical protein